MGKTSVSAAPPFTACPAVGRGDEYFLVGSTYLPAGMPTLRIDIRPYPNCNSDTGLQTLATRLFDIGKLIPEVFSNLLIVPVFGIHSLSTAYCFLPAAFCLLFLSIYPLSFTLSLAISPLSLMSEVYGLLSESQLS